MVERLESIWDKRVRDILESDNPLKGIYCVYSMYWNSEEEIKQSEEYLPKQILLIKLFLQFVKLRILSIKESIDYINVMANDF